MELAGTNEMQSTYKENHDARCPSCSSAVEMCGHVLNLDNLATTSGGGPNILVLVASDTDTGSKGMADITIQQQQQRQPELQE